MTLQGKILITGGAGFLGRAIVRRAVINNWDCSFTILSRDPEKHHKMQLEFSECRYVICDICDLNGLSKAFSGHDIVIHAGAQKHIPEGERDVSETIRVNVDGSENVARAAIEARIGRVVGISTDKVAHPVNVYGASKMIMERLFQEYDRLELTMFNLVRYGNVLSSTGSVLTVWQRMLERDGYVTATDKNMSRFWMSIDQAVDAVLLALDEPSGTVTIPKCKALSMGDFAKYTMPEGTEFRYSGIRPGEKRYEELITDEEAPFAVPGHKIYPSVEIFKKHLEYFRLYPRSMSENYPVGDQVNFLKDAETKGYRSDSCDQIDRDELLEMLK